MTQKNLRTHGYLRPVGLAYRPNGYIDTFIFQWETLEEKRQQQEYFQIKLLKRDAVAAVVISEIWAKVTEDAAIHLGDRAAG